MARKCPPSLPKPLIIFCHAPPPSSSDLPTVSLPLCRASLGILPLVVIVVVVIVIVVVSPPPPCHPPCCRHPRCYCRIPPWHPPRARRSPGGARTAPTRLTRVDDKSPGRCNAGLLHAPLESPPSHRLLHHRRSCRGHRRLGRA